jgi:hypothetical protein
MKKHIKVLALVVWIAMTATSAFAQKSSGPVIIKDADNAARQPWAELVQIELVASATPVYAFGDISVPVDKRLVIESYSGPGCSSWQGVYLVGEVGVTTNGTMLPHYLKFDSFPFAASGSVQLRWNGTGAVRLYADPGSTVRVGLKRGYSSQAGSICAITLSGYLVDLP